MTDPQRQQMADLFDAVAPTYDAVGVDFFGPIAHRLVAELAPQPGERAADIGCGKGAALLPLAAAVGSAGRAVGVDLSPAMVVAARHAVTAARLRAEVSVGDAQSPALTRHSFDLVASSLVLFFLPDPLAALAAWHDLLVEGGRVGVSTFGPYSEHWKAVDAVFAPFLPTGTLDPRTQPAGSPFDSDAGVEALLATAGFTDVRTAGTTAAARFDDADHWHAWTWSVGQRRMWMAVPEDQRDDVRRLAAERLERCRCADGGIGFDQQVRFTLGRRS